MGVRQDKDGRWYACHSKRHPKTRKPMTLKRYGKSKFDAQQIFKELVIELDDRCKEVLVPKWSSFVDEYIETCRVNGLTAKTINNIDKCLKAATLDDWCDRFIDTITADEIRQLIRIKYGDRSQSYQKSLRKFINCAFSLALDAGYINRNPTPKMSFRIGDKLKGVYNAEQVRFLLNKAKALDWHWYRHYVMACYCGMRNGELYALTWDQVDLDQRQIKVDRAWNNKDGFKSTKSGDDRMVEIAPNLLILLKQWKLEGKDRFVLPRLKEWDTGRQAEKFREFATGIGLPQIRFHDLRASWCTILLSQGVEPVKVMKMGGWKDLKTMMKYLRQAGVDIKGITDNLDLHDPIDRTAKVVNLDFGSDS